MPKASIQLEDIPQKFLSPVFEDDSVVYAIKKILADQLTIVLRCQDGAKNSDEPYDLHQMRIAIRRMRTTLQIMKPYIDKDMADALLKQMRQSGSVLGKVRDIDSFITWLGRIRENLRIKIRIAVDGIKKDYKKIRKIQMQRVIDEIDGESYQQWVELLVEFLKSNDNDKKRTIKKHSPVILNGLLDYINGTTNNAEAASFKKLHKFRIRCKWLRYFCEFFDEAYGGRLQPVIKETKVLQSSLGLIQDHTRDIQLLKDNQERLAKELNAVDKNSVSALIKFFRRQRKNARKRFQKEWKNYMRKRSQKRFRKLFAYK